ncbi:uncharacterized protein L203_106331 [Cryptococcus depauperatus CBS 7841]|uniref:Uncharacterized protein n=1 Tax=Cryptococcus depauperatus CBS 7841 TaxID=1295531 RepID=A0A1E3IJ73_9TREE|nr:hypothetical protein L203_02670 [Cryptococcus depauperatus CBS 7841]
MRSSLTLFTFLSLLSGTLGNTCKRPTPTNGGASTNGPVNGNSGGSSANPSTSGSTASNVGATDIVSPTATTTGNGPGGSSKATPSDTLKLDEPQGDCKCGYSISSLGDIYFPYHFSFAFSSEKDRVFGSEKELSDKGWVVNEGRHAGGEGDSGLCLGRYKNLAIEKGDLVLTVPGGQTLNKNMGCAEIAHNAAVFGGVFQTEAMISPVAGTCEAFWLNHTIPTQYADEVDIEILTGKIQSDGIYYTNWPPYGDPNNPSTMKSEFTKAPFPDLTNNDPTKTYNNYTIVWLNGDGGKNETSRYFNGKFNQSPVANLPVHAMSFTINNWSNGSPGWSGGPPKEDAHLRVKSVILYYKTEEVGTMEKLDKGCTKEKVCKV